MQVSGPQIPNVCLLDLKNKSDSMVSSFFKWLDSIFRGKPAETKCTG